MQKDPYSKMNLKKAKLFKISSSLRWSQGNLSCHEMKVQKVRLIGNRQNYCKMIRIGEMELVELKRRNRLNSARRSSTCLKMMTRIIQRPMTRI